MPNILSVSGTPLYKQIIAKLQGDVILTGALGNGADSIYPNYTTDGPSTDRNACPTPFIIVAPIGIQATDRSGREIKTVIEIHDDEDQGEQRWPGILAYLKQILIIKEYKAQSDDYAHYITGLYFESESPPDLPDERYGATMIQLIIACKATDKTSLHGYTG